MDLTPEPESTPIDDQPVKLYESLVPPDQRRMIAVVLDGVAVDEAVIARLEERVKEVVAEVLVEVAYSSTPLEESAVEGVPGGGLAGLQLIANEGFISELLPD